MNEVEKCPDECMFDWKKFHADLDTALAHMITEQGVRPSKVSYMEFLHYVSDKKDLYE